MIGNDLFFVMFNKFNGKYWEAAWKNNCMSRETIRIKRNICNRFGC